MERLSKLSEETVSLDIAIGIRSIPLFSISGEHALRVVNDRQESTNILPLGATCKILLSQFSEEELETVLRNIRLNSLIHNYAANKELIIGELNRIKKQGYTVSHGERVIGALGISVPITNYDCPVSLSIVGYDFRLLPKVSEFVEELKMSADRISKNILEFIPKSNAEKDQNQSV
jgi:DNA-binding IclR family transcriptional regulator